jgi:CRP/FNR family transcriptional regulator, cyclic AMP receptor protein
MARDRRSNCRDWINEARIIQISQTKEGGQKQMNDKDFNSSDPTAFFTRVGLGQRTIEAQPGQVFFSQGDPADYVFCLQRGRAILQVVTPKGKQTTLALFSPGEFFGEESLASAPGRRMATASAINRCIAFKIKRDEMVGVMRRESGFSAQFLSLLVARGIRNQADLVDQKLNRSEMRLARTLLLMAEFARPDEPRGVMPPITQETLAEVIGTTRSRCSFFMNRFRTLGLIQYKDRIHVHKSRLEKVLVNQFANI